MLKMNQKSFLALAILGIILVGGCTGEKVATGRTEGSDTKPALTPTLSTYGKLIDFSDTDELAILKIQTDIINWRLNNTFLTVTVNKSAAFKEYNREINDYSRKSYDYKEENYALRMWYSKENYYISDITKLEPNVFYYFNFICYDQNGSAFDNNVNDVFGQFVSYNKDKNSLDIYSIWNNEENLNTIYMTKNKQFEWETTENSSTPRSCEFMYAQRPWRTADLSVGNNYVFHLWKLFEKEGSWDRMTISENLTEYQQNGASYHENDLVRDQMTTTEDGKTELEPGQQLAVRIIPTIISAGKPTELKISLINKQDNKIRYKIKDAKIVNEQASQWYGPWWQLSPYEERLKNAVIDECIVSFNPSESTISSHSTEILTFMVDCPVGIDITRSYDICDNYEERRNCRTETAGRTDNLMLWGEIEYTDELGNVHIFPEKGVLKQSLEIRN